MAISTGLSLEQCKQINQEISALIKAGNQVDVILKCKDAIENGYPLDFEFDNQWKRYSAGGRPKNLSSILALAIEHHMIRVLSYLVNEGSLDLNKEIRGGEDTPMTLAAGCIAYQPENYYRFKTAVELLKAGADPYGQPTDFLDFFLTLERREEEMEEMIEYHLVNATAEASLIKQLAALRCRHAAFLRECFILAEIPLWENDNILNTPREDIEKLPVKGAWLEEVRRQTEFIKAPLQKKLSVFQSEKKPGFSMSR